MTNEKDTRKIAIYSRKSKFTGKGESVENQIEMCKNKLKLHYEDINFENDIIIYEDEGFTGYNTKRPEFQKLLTNIRNNKIKLIVFYKLDRVSRNVNDFSNLLNEFNRYNVKFLSATENLENITPTGKAMLMMTSVFSQLERDTIAERIRDNMLELAKTGRWLGGNAPTGYKSKEIENVSVDGKSKKLFKLVFVNEEIEIVKLIFNKFLEKKSLTSVESYLIINDIKSKKNCNYSRWAIKNILTNPVYAKADEDTLNYFKNKNIEIYNNDEWNGKWGVMAYNKTFKKSSNGTIVKRDVSDWIIAIGKHKGILSGADWVKMQALLIKNSDKKYRLPIKNNSILNGIVKCFYCGNSMIPKVKQTYNDNGELNFNYICKLKYDSRGTKCNCKNSNGNEVDHLVLKTVCNLAKSDSEFYKIIKKLNNSFKVDFNDIEASCNTLKITITKNEMYINNLMENIKYITDTTLISNLQKQILELKDKNKILNNELIILKSKIVQVDDDKKISDMVLNILDTYLSIFNDLDLIEKREYLRLFINDVQLDGENIVINLYNPNPNVLFKPVNLCERFK